MTGQTALGWPGEPMDARERPRLSESGLGWSAGDEPPQSTSAPTSATEEAAPVGVAAGGETVIEMDHPPHPTDDETGVSRETEPSSCEGLGRSDASIPGETQLAPAGELGGRDIKVSPGSKPAPAVSVSERGTGVSRETTVDPMMETVHGTEQQPAWEAGVDRRTRIMAVANQKGGVGKTTSTVNIAAALGQADFDVLVIDLDPQGNASTALGVGHTEGTAGVYEVLIEGEPLSSVVQASDKLGHVWCAPSTIDVAGAEIELVNRDHREHRLQTALNEAGVAHSGSASETRSGSAGFDYVLIDCPPSLGLLTINALTAATEVLIPIQCEYYALEGLSQLMRNIDLISRHLNPTLYVSAILMTMFDGRTNLSSQVASELRSHFGDLVLSTTIPRSVRISEAPSHGETVLTYDPSSAGAMSYRDVAVELSTQAVPSPSKGVQTK